MTESNGNGRPTSWRDVYELVEGVEERLTKAIEALGHRVSSQELAIRDLQDVNLVRDTRTKAIRDVFGDWRTLALTLVACTQLVLAAYVVISR